MALDLVTIEEPVYQKVLRDRAKPVEFPLNDETKALLDAMEEKLYELGGVGLAAPQINISQQIIAIYIPEDASVLRDEAMPYPMHFLLNPRWEPTKEALKVEDFEACYSVSSKAGKIERYSKIKVSYFDRKGVPQEFLATGFYARVLQHEIDHLHGTLIIDHLRPDSLQGSLAEIRALRRASLTEEQRLIYDRLLEKK